jgi:hypothetical protein
MPRVQVLEEKERKWHSQFPRMTRTATTVPSAHIATRAVQKARKARNGCIAPSVYKAVQVTAVPTPDFSALSVHMVNVSG